MGVTGLWSLLEPVGKPIPLESLENKILAIDVSIWLNQAVKGFRDRSGNAVANAHLLGLFHRICKLLFYRIRPIFVFDGKAPALKRETLARRRHRKNAAKDKSDAARMKLLENYVKRQAVASKLKRQTHALDNVLKTGQAGLHKLLNDRSKNNEKDLFELPARNQEFVESSSSSDEEDGHRVLKNAALSMLSGPDGADIHTLDVESAAFKSLPVEVQYEVLTEIKERRKQNSWHKMSEMPQNAEGFSGFQLERLRKRKQVQSTLEDVGKTIGEETSADLDAHLFVGDREGIKKAKRETRKIASTGGAFSVYVTGLKEKEAKTKKDEVELCKLMHPKLEQRELNSSSESSQSDADEDSDDDKELSALKMAAETDMSQDEILAMIKASKTTTKPSLSDDDTSDIEILEPTTSNVTALRSGGRRMTLDEEGPSSSTAKSEVAVDSKKEEGNQEEGLTIEVKQNVDVMSDSGSESEDDLFADVFADSSQTKALDSILASAAGPTNKPPPPSSADSGATKKHPDAKIVESVTQFDYTDDVFAQISKKVRRFSESEKEAKFSGKVAEQKPVAAAEQTKQPPVNKEIAESMKKSDHLWLKLASKWADEPSDKPGPSKPPPKQENIPSNAPNTRANKDETLMDFDDETAKLVREMRQKEKEDRLLSIKRWGEENEGGAKKGLEPVDEVEEADGEVLDQLGVKVVPQSKFEKEVMKEQGWQHDDDKDAKAKNDVIYGDSAPGFVRSKKYDVVEAVTGSDTIPDEVFASAIEKLETEAEEPEALTEAELIALQEKLANEQETLIAERGKEERLAASIGDQMYAECQELLRLFGIPWVVSPSEAEAQCAFLDDIGLSHGTITDDSDIWVFGGKTVYKNFFEKEKYCETFSVAEITKHFGLTREKMILLAMLTGSDYTEGIDNVGPVTAMEILAEFSGDGMVPLECLKAWWTENLKETKMPGNQARAKLKKLHFPDSFPNGRVFQAYTEPSVDPSEERFSWAVPNFVAVRDFATEKFGWTKVKIDEMVKPVIKKMSGPYQGRIDNFFLSERHKLPKKGSLQYSKRIKSALEKVVGPKKDGSGTEEKPKAVKAAKASKTAKPAAPKKKEVAAGLSATSTKKAVEQPPHVVKPLQSEAAMKLEARKRAAEIFKKSQVEKKTKKAKASDIKRKVLASHNLSESESD